MHKKQQKLIRNILILSGFYNFAFATPLSGLDDVLNTPQAIAANEIPVLQPITPNAQDPITKAPITKESTVKPLNFELPQPHTLPLNEPQAAPQQQAPQIAPNPHGEGSVFIFPLPLEQIALPPQRPTEANRVEPISSQATSQATSSEIMSIITDAEITEYLGDGPFPDNGPNHQVVRMKAEYVPIAPPRAIESILADTASQPTIDTALNMGGSLLLSTTPNPALRGQTLSNIEINTPLSRPQGLEVPKNNASLPPIVSPTINSGGRLNIKYKNIRYEKLGSCTVRQVRQVTAVGRASILPAAVMQKDFSVKIAQFERDVVQPAAQRHYGVPVTQIKHLSGFRCTNIAGTRNLSEHSKANALDVSSFVFADGRSVNLTKGWRGSKREQRFLRELQAGACKIFGTTLTPNYNRAHYNHFHFDDKTRKSKAICK